MPNNIFENIFIPLNVIYKKTRTVKTSPVERPNFSVNMFEWLKSALIELNITPGSGGCDCPPNKYEIVDICNDITNLLIKITVNPLFTYTTPLTLFTTLYPYVIGYPDVAVGITYVTVPEVVLNSNIILTFGVGGGVITDQDMNFQITDNKGNYSDVFTIDGSLINNC